ncbi:Ribose-5-phosphate isomerase [Paramicrosporidium saccamoebae]|uniref:Ribose-5-phosphate isomerase n=1 Tax=Paramicrosporidium saccamoebae TaxID=1246581 RepID=A0A2H9TKK7_9FUNG|nr:Ribose-5-phosphate isomerase [Paramicrosporidium saccamoebae]
MKKAVAHAALDELKGFFDQGFTEERPFVFGLGTGSTVAEFWPIFHKYLQTTNQKNVVIIPTSHQSKQLVLSSSCRYPLVEPQQYPTVDCLVDGFDEIELCQGGMLKGGGGAHTLEKLVAQCSKHTIYIGTYEKVGEKLGNREVAIPVEAEHVRFAKAIKAKWDLSLLTWAT